MTGKNIARPFFRAVTVTMLTVALLVPSVALSDHKRPNFNKSRINFGFDVAEIGARFVPDDAPFVDGFPAYGNSFITQGFIYPAGTLRPCDNETVKCEGVNMDGSAQWPDKVIGHWTCFGWHVADAADPGDSLVAVVTTQIYEFSDIPGKITFVSDGFERNFFDDTRIRRAVTGGTGPLSRVSGQVTQSFLGFPNVGGGVNLKFRASLRRK